MMTHTHNTQTHNNKKNPKKTPKKLYLVNMFDTGQAARVLRVSARAA